MPCNCIVHMYTNFRCFKEIFVDAPMDWTPMVVTTTWLSIWTDHTILIAALTTLFAILAFDVNITSTPTTTWWSWWNFISFNYVDTLWASVVFVSNLTSILFVGTNFLWIWCHCTWWHLSGVNITSLWLFLYGLKAHICQWSMHRVCLQSLLW